MKEALMEKLLSEKSRLQAELAVSNGNGIAPGKKDHFPGYEISHVHRLMDEYNHNEERIAQCEGYGEVAIQEPGTQPAVKKATKRPAVKKAAAKRK